MSSYVWLLIVLALMAQNALDTARAMVANGETAKAIRLLESRSQREPSAAELALLAQLQASEGAIPRAVASLERAIELAPEQVGLRITLGAMLFELRRFEEARRLLEDLIEEAPDAPLAHYYLAAVLKAAGELETAEKEAALAVALTPPTGSTPAPTGSPPPAAAVRHLLAEIRFELDEEVEPLLREVLQIEPLHSSARYLLGRVLLRQGREKQARAELETFESIRRADRHLERAEDLARIGARPSEVLTELRLAVEAHPAHSRALYLLGAALLRSGLREEGREVLERAVALRPALRQGVERLLESAR